jgi:hypothetical protein
VGTFLSGGPAALLLMQWPCLLLLLLLLVLLLPPLAPSFCRLPWLNDNSVVCTP